MNQQAPILVNVLAGLLRQRGSGLLGDRRRTLGLLRDKVPNEGRAIRILMTAFDQGVPARLGRGSVSELDIGREAALLSAETGIGPDLAREAVETWAFALAHGEALPPPAAAPAPAVQALPLAPLRPEFPAPAAAAVHPSPAIAPPAPAPSPVPPPAATNVAVDAAPSPSRSPRSQPVTVRQVLKGPSRPAAPPLHDAPAPATGPADRPASPEQAAPVAAEPASMQPPSVQPLPVQPLPVQPLSVQPLPVQRLQASADEPPAPRRLEAAPAAASPKGGGLQKWAGIIVGLLAMVSGGAKLIGAFSPGGRSAPPPAATSPAKPPAAPPAAEPARPTTAEGVVVLSPSQSAPTYRYQRIKDDPTTLAFYFGIPYKGQTYTYYFATALDDGKTTGSSMLVLIRDKQQTSSGAFPIELHQSSTQNFIDSIAKVPNKYGAPNLCIFLSLDPKTDRLDPVSSGSVGVYGITAQGGCDFQSSYGYANLTQ